MTTPPSPLNAVQRVLFHYIKSKFFRVIHVDGVIGGVTPAGFIHMTVFNERPALPQTSDHPLTPDGGLGPPVLSGREGFVREMDVDIMMSRAAAESMKNWLSERLKDLDNQAGPQ